METASTLRRRAALLVGIIFPVLLVALAPEALATISKSRLDMALLTKGEVSWKLDRSHALRSSPGIVSCNRSSSLPYEHWAGRSYFPTFGRASVEEALFSFSNRQDAQRVMR